MKRGKIATGLILIVISSLAIILANLQRKDASAEFLEGYIPDSKIDSKQRYKDTLINYSDIEANWKPKEKTEILDQPEIAGKAGIIADINSGNILFEKNSTEKRKIASLVKIMTAVIALEHKDINEKIYVTERAASIGENTMGLTAGEIYTLEELLYGLMLVSGNDAAYTIAEGVAGNPKRFAEWMNYKAKELGLYNTEFKDPSGLDNSSYSTTEDLLKLTRYALKNPIFKEIAKTVEYEIPNNGKHKYIYLYNQTNLLTTYPGVEGVKTGFTEEAGLCLATYAKNSGMELVGVILNSIDRKGDMILMLDYSFASLGINIEHNLL